MQNLAPQLNRALDRRLTRTGVPSPASGQSPADWLANAVRRGSRATDAVQALTRAGVPLADILRAVSLSRAALGRPAKTAATLAAKALGLPALPVRLATLAWSLARTVGRSLTR